MVIAGTSGSLEDDTNFTFDGDQLSVKAEIAGFTHLQTPFSSSKINITVTVATKTAAHRYESSGSSSGYFLNGIESPVVTLTPGNTYKFFQGDSSNTGHTIKFYLEADKTTEYTTGVTGVGTAGSGSACTEIVVGDETPPVLFYMCTAHGYMGNAAVMNSNVVNSNYAAILRGGLNVSGAETVLSSATISDLTNTRIP